MDEIRAFAAATSPDAPAAAQRILRRMLFDRYRAYRASGLAGIAPYARDGDAVRRPAHELGGACDAGGLLERYAPPLWAVLHAYPRGTPPGFEERFLRAHVRPRRPSQLHAPPPIALPFGGGIVVADRDFYVSRGYNAALAVGGLFPVPDGTIVFYANRVSTDQLLGSGRRSGRASAEASWRSGSRRSSSARARASNARRRARRRSPRAAR
jgi:hypothetical protein